MEKLIPVLVVITFLFASCRKAYTCTCTTLQPGIANFNTVVTVDNTHSKAKEVCNSFGLTVAETATTTCVLK